MKRIPRRTLFKGAFFSTFALPFFAPKLQTPPEGLEYSDSTGRTTAQCAALYDGIKTSGGISYSA